MLIYLRKYFISENYETKGAKFTNILIFIGAWSTLKVPMFLFEMSALGYNFAITRWIASLIGVIFMAFIIDKMTLKEEKKEIYKKHNEDMTR